MQKNLFTIGNPKTQKGRKLGYLTAVLHLAPYDASGVGNVCPYASAGCVAACLNTAGRGGIFKKGAITNAIQEARKRRTREFFADRASFVGRLHREIARLLHYAEARGLKLAVRLNGTSDLRWHKLAPSLFADYPMVQFYDYTKDSARMHENMPTNYHLTFSRSEENEAEALGVNVRGGNVAFVLTRECFERVGSPLVERGYLGAHVDGDAHDLRFLDPKGALVVLLAKGRAKSDKSGFVLR